MGGRSELVFETIEHLNPENGLYRVETFNAFLEEQSLLLARRTVAVRIDSPLGVTRLFSRSHPVTVAFPNDCSATLALDLRGAATLGRFRFFYALGGPMPASAEPDAEESTVGAAAGPRIGTSERGIEREFVEPRRFRLRRRGELRRLP